MARSMVRIRGVLEGLLAVTVLASAGGVRAEEPVGKSKSGSTPPAQADKARDASPGKPSGGSASKTDEVQGDEAPRSMDELLDDALVGRKPIELGGGEGDKTRPKKAPELPKTPGASELLEAIKVIAPALRACAKGQAGNAFLVVVLRGDGRVESARLSGPPFAGTETGSCMEGVTRRAHFPRFKRAQFRLRVPLALQ